MGWLYLDISCQIIRFALEICKLGSYADQAINRITVYSQMLE